MANKTQLFLALFLLQTSFCSADFLDRLFACTDAYDRCDERYAQCGWKCIGGKCLTGCVTGLVTVPCCVYVSPPSGVACCLASYYCCYQHKKYRLTHVPGDWVVVEDADACFKAAKYASYSSVAAVVTGALGLAAQEMSRDS